MQGLERTSAGLRSERRIRVGSRGATAREGPASDRLISSEAGPPAAGPPSRRLASGALAAALLGLGPRLALAQDGWLAQESASGDWGGARQRLVEAGITPAASYTTDLLGNPKGGARQGFEYAGELEASLEFDLERLLGVSGSSFFIGASWTSGRDLSERRIGNLFTVAQVFEGQSVRLAQMYFEQALLEDRLSLAIGRLSAGEDFATSELYDNYVSSGVNGNPASLSTNAPSFSSDPVAAWGMRAIFEPDARWRLAAGVYNADPRIGEDDRNGVDFVLDPQDGVLAIAEAGWRRNQADGDAGLPGNLTVGGYYDSSDYATFGDPDDERAGNYGLYLLLDQMVYREGGAGSAQGLTPWATFTLAPLQRVNALPFFAAAGLVWQGLFSGRDDDTSNLGVYYGRFSDEEPDQTFETVVEVNHRFQVAPWLYVTPDLQYVIRPGGSDEEPDALVLGAEIGIDF